MQIDFVALTQSDIRFLSDLLNEPAVVSSLHNAAQDYDTWLQTYLQFWANDADEAHFVIRADEKPVGWLKINGLLSNNTAWISMLVISGKTQSKGIGRRAVAFAEAFLFDKGFRKIGIHTTCDNLAAIALYIKSGYILTEYGDCTTGDGANRTGYTFMKEIRQQA